MGRRNYRDLVHSVTAGGKVYHYYRPPAELIALGFGHVRLPDVPDLLAAAKKIHAANLEIAPSYAVAAENRVQEELEAIVREACVAAKWRAAKRGREFSLTPDGIVDLLKKQGYRCAITGMDFNTDSAGELKARKKPFRPSLDRIDNARGYTPDNVQIVCTCANVAKNEWGYDTLLKLCLATIRERQTVKLL